VKVRRHVPGPGFWASIRNSRWVSWIIRIFSGERRQSGKGTESQWLARVNRESLVIAGDPSAPASPPTGAPAEDASPSGTAGSANPAQHPPTPPSRDELPPTGQSPRNKEPMGHRLRNRFGRRFNAVRDWLQLDRWFKTFMAADWRWLLGGTLAFTLIAGYLLAALVFFPAPFLNSDRPIPRVIGLDSAEAVAVLKAAGFTAGEPRLESHPSVPRGSVSWQDPPEDIAAPAGALVRLSVSRGPQDIPVPDVSRYESGLARMLIGNAGLTVRRVDSIPTALPRDVAVGTRPSAGSTLPPGSPVVLIVSLGAPTLSVPDLRGLTLDEAREVLTAAGLTLGRSWREFSNAQPADLIFRQEPPVGTLIAPGSPVNVVLARTP